MVELYLVQALN